MYRSSVPDYCDPDTSSSMGTTGNTPRIWSARCSRIFVHVSSKVKDDASQVEFRIQANWYIQPNCMSSRLQLSPACRRYFRLCSSGITSERQEAATESWVFQALLSRQTRRCPLVIATWPISLIRQITLHCPSKSKDQRRTQIRISAERRSSCTASCSWFRPPMRCLLPKRGSNWK